MALSLSAIAKREKNKLSTNSAFIILLDINLPDVIRICYNTDDVIWQGNLYQSFPFKFGKVNETQDGSEPNVDLQVSNIAQVIQYYVEQGNGGNGTEVILRVVNTEALDNPKAELEEHYIVQKSASTAKWVTFTLGCEYSSRTRRPINRYMKNNCPFKYKGVKCGYNGSLACCNHTLSDCRAHNNSKRFGGFPGIDQKGVYL